jgi:hypothetical protein
VNVRHPPIEPSPAGPGLGGPKNVPKRPSARQLPTPSSNDDNDEHDGVNGENRGEASIPTSGNDGEASAIANGAVGDDHDPFDGAANNNSNAIVSGVGSDAADMLDAGDASGEGDVPAEPPLTDEDVARDNANVPTTEAELAEWIRQHTVDQDDQDDLRPHAETYMFGGEEDNGDVLVRGKRPPFIVIAYNFGRKRSIGGMQQRFEQLVYGLAHLGAQLHCVSTRKVCHLFISYLRKVAVRDLFLRFCDVARGE